jgi:hypothetical protein
MVATRISSSRAVLAKWAFPVLLCGMLSVVFVPEVAQGQTERSAQVWIGPVFMLVMGAVLFRVFLWNLADSVHDHGSYLVAKRRGVEARIPFANIMSAKSANPRYVTLLLVEESALGRQITFVPETPLTLNPFAKSEIAEQLDRRAHAARLET